MPRHPALRLLLGLHDALTRVGFLGGTAALVVVTGSYVYEVIVRYFLASPTTWASDVVGYAVCIGVFLMLPQVTATRGHVAVTLLLDNVRPALAQALRRLINLLGFLFCGFAAWISLQENIRQFLRNTLTLANDPIPKVWVTGFITFGLALAALHFLRHLLAPPAAPAAGATAGAGPTP